MTSSLVDDDKKLSRIGRTNGLGGGEAEREQKPTNQIVSVIRPDRGMSERSKACDNTMEIRKLKTDNRLLKQRVDNLEKETTTMGTRLIQKQAKIARQDEELAALRSVANLAPPTTTRTASDANSNREQCLAEVAAAHPVVSSAQTQSEREENVGRLQRRINELNEREADACDTIRQLNDKISELETINEKLSEPASVELLSIQDELVACKLREAEANLSMKELQQNVQKLERHWQQFLQDTRSDGVTTDCKGKVQQPPQLDQREMIMALRLRETHLVSDLNEIKTKLMERETQNHIYERQLKRQDAERTDLQEKILSAQLNENELKNSMKDLERKIGDLQTKCKEDIVVCKIREAEYSQTAAEMRRRIAELEIENQERLTSAELHDKDAYIRELEHRVVELLDEVKTYKLQGQLGYSGGGGRLQDMDMSDDMTASFYNDLHLLSNPINDYITSPTSSVRSNGASQLPPATRSDGSSPLTDSPDNIHDTSAGLSEHSDSE